ncbi:MAG: serine/threonine protein kinase [Polyangiaceae bacterium]|nr:serine/threonine protein kinase [Polyangiaceae bacterium]
MNTIPGDDLSMLIGRSLPSDYVSGVEYRIEHYLGQGAMAVAFYAMRTSPEGHCPAVAKVLRPSFLRDYGKAAAVSVLKEAVALGRLNEAVPSTPFVVRLLDTGSITVVDRFGPISLPWVSLEYVHGGPEGTTLSQRVTNSAKSTGYAFGIQRAANAIRCFCEGVGAVHGVGVIHRDLKPANILCCGTGDCEIFKVADFGISKQTGLDATFFGDVIGTLGYVAPEAFGTRGTACGPWTDVFSLAGIVYFILTGKKYLRCEQPSDIASVVASNSRPSLVFADKLCPELRDNRAACIAIDKALATATSWNPSDRPASASEFSAMLLPWLEQKHMGFSQCFPSVRKTLPPPPTTIAEPHQPKWNWIIRYRPSDSIVIRKAAWDTGGRCLATTHDGLFYWTGTGWERVTVGRNQQTEPRLVHHAEPNQWLVTSGNAVLARYSAQGILDSTDLSRYVRYLDALDGKLGDIVAMVDRTRNDQPVLRTMIGWRWLKPIPLDGIVSVSSIARVGDDQWLFAGRGESGFGAVGMYYPLDFHAELLSTQKVRAFVACAGRDMLEMGIAGGADGAVMWKTASECYSETIRGGHDVSAVAIDPSGEGWAAGAGRIWRRRTETRSTVWQCVWENDAWTVPFVALYADLGMVTAMTADGAIVEGREGRSSRGRTEIIEADETVRNSEWQERYR